MAKPSPGSDVMPPDILGMSFEQALAELETIVQKLEGGAASLEASIDLYGRGSLLRRHCEAKLRAAQERVEKIVVGEGGAVRAEAATFE